MSDSESFESADEGDHEFIFKTQFKKDYVETKKVTSSEEDNKIYSGAVSQKIEEVIDYKNTECDNLAKNFLVKSDDKNDGHIGNNEEDTSIKQNKQVSINTRDRDSDNKQDKVNKEKKEKKVNISKSKHSTVSEINDEENMWEEDWNEWDSPENDNTVTSKTVKDSYNKWDSPENDNNSHVTSKTVKDTYNNNLKYDNTNTTNDSWGSWSNWGVSLLSTATSSVSTMTNQMTQGISSALEIGMGIPDPEELAKIKKEASKQDESDTNDNKHIPTTNIDSDGGEEQEKSFKLENLLTGVTHITKFVETTGNKVITGGLGTLETIGKKTMEVLQEGDPGLKKKRAYLNIDSGKPNLSQILREAREKPQYETSHTKHYVKRIQYETLFDDHHGLVHLEALEMLSKQCNIKLQSLYESENSLDMQETLNQIRELCELPEDDTDDDFNVEEQMDLLKDYVAEINIPISYDKLLLVWKEAENWLEKTLDFECKLIHEKAIMLLAHLTAISIEQFHKSAEILLTKQHRSTADEADSFVQITIILSRFINYVASQFCKKMDNLKSESQTMELITNIYFEAANSGSYIKDAFKLLLPVIEIGAI